MKLRNFVLAALVCAATVGTARLESQERQPANPEHVRQLKETRLCAKCDLRNADLTGADLYGADLREASLEGAIFIEANLELANLEGATGAVLAGARTDTRTVCPNGKNGPCE